MMTTAPTSPNTHANPPAPAPDELRAFLLVVRQALLMMVRYIEHRYQLDRK